MQQEREPLPREEVEAAVRARGELGAELEPELIEGFLDRTAKAIDARVDERLRSRGIGAGGRLEESKAAIGVALGSLGIGIPLTGAAGGTAGTFGILVVWIGIVLVNFAYALGRRR